MINEIGMKTIESFLNVITALSVSNMIVICAGLLADQCKLHLKHENRKHIGASEVKWKFIGSIHKVEQCSI